MGAGQYNQLSAAGQEAVPLENLQLEAPRWNLLVFYFHLFGISQLLWELKKFCDLTVALISFVRMKQK